MRVITQKYIPEIGDIVLISNESLKMIDWPLRRLLQIYTSGDDIVRRSKVKTLSGVVVRPIQKLCPLELDYGKSSTKVGKQSILEVTQKDLIVFPQFPILFLSFPVQFPPFRILMLGQQDPDAIFEPQIDAEHEVLIFRSKSPETQQGGVFRTSRFIINSPLQERALYAHERD
ncbi:DUF5641 domain-containing protein [Trichonephila clavipes]|nr:DUF5641 domain-containing protein [Trichonephila clavipes]